MTNPTPEAIEAAARALCAESNYTFPAEATHDATVALTAAYPFIQAARLEDGVWTMTDAEFKRELAQAKAAALREAADDLWSLSPKLKCNYVEYIRARAATIEGKSE